MRYLFFDSELSGHHSEYIHHVVNYLVENNFINDTYIFVVHPDFCVKFDYIVNKVENFDNIQFHTILREELINLKVKNRFKRSQNNFILMNKYALSNYVDFSYLMHINVFQIAIGLNRFPYKIRGILFMQFTNMNIYSLRSFYYFLRRVFPFYIMNFNKRSIDKIFVLNDAETAKDLNVKFNTNLYLNLPDPINYYVPKDALNLKEQYEINDSVTVLLHSGSLADRKGTLETINSLNFLNDSKKYILLLVGKCSNIEFEKLIIDAIDSIKKNDNIKCFWVNEFVSDNKLSSFFNISDCILMPYKNAEASSGILGHAIAHQKKVIVPNKGLISGIVDELELGIKIDTITPQNIANAIEQIDKFSINKNKCILFYKDHSPFQFSKRLLC